MPSAPESKTNKAASRNCEGRPWHGHWKATENDPLPSSRREFQSWLRLHAGLHGRIDDRLALQHSVAEVDDTLRVLRDVRDSSIRRLIALAWLSSYSAPARPKCFIVPHLTLPVPFGTFPHQSSGKYG